MAKDRRPVYTAAIEAAAQARFDEFVATWGGQYPSTDAIESLNAFAIPLAAHVVPTHGSRPSRPVTPFF